MDSLLEIINDNTINYGTAFFRLFCAFIAGGIIGFEREYRRQSAGLRTHILICIGSALMMILSIYIPQQFFSMKNGDPGRIAAQVVSGIGFLGAGAIIKFDNNIKGLTTAASIWVSAGIGLALGAGLYIPSIIALVLIIIALVLLENMEKKLFSNEKSISIGIYIKDGNTDINEIKEMMKRNKVKINYIEVSSNIIEKDEQINMSISTVKENNFDMVIKEIKMIDKLCKLEIKEKM